MEEEGRNGYCIAMGFSMDEYNIYVYLYEGTMNI